MIQTTNLNPEDLQLNHELELVLPQQESEENNLLWLNLFRLIRYMHRASLVSKENIPKFINNFQISKDKEQYLGKLNDYIGDKIDENKLLNNIFKQDEITRKLKEALEIIPAENAAQFIGEIFNGNPPEQLLKDLGITVQEMPRFTPQEVELLQQAKIQDILQQSKRRPLNAKNIINTPGYNKPFSPDQVGQIIDQFGTNYQQYQQEQSIRQQQEANIPSRYHVREGQNTDVGTVLENVQPINTAGFNPNQGNNSQPNFEEHATVRTMPARNIAANSSAPANPNMGQNYPVNRQQAPVNNQQIYQSNQSFPQTGQQIQNQQMPVGQQPNPNYRPGNPQATRPMPVNNFRMNPMQARLAPNRPNPVVAPVANPNPALNTSGFRGESSLPHKTEHGLADLLN